MSTTLPQGTPQHTRRSRVRERITTGDLPAKAPALVEVLEPAAPPASESVAAAESEPAAPPPPPPPPSEAQVHAPARAAAPAGPTSASASAAALASASYMARRVASASAPAATSTSTSTSKTAPRRKRAAPAPPAQVAAAPVEPTAEDLQTLGLLVWRARRDSRTLPDYIAECRQVVAIADQFNL